MNISLPNIILFVSITLSLLSFVVLVVLLQKISELGSWWRRLFRIEKRVHGKLNKKLSEKHEKEMDDIFSEVSKLFAEEVRSQVENFSKEASVEIKKFSEFLGQQQEAIIKKSEVMIASAVNKSNEDIEAYRKAQMESITNKVYKVVTGASKEVIARSLNPNEHEELVEKAVEKAKSENFFV